MHTYSVGSVSWRTLTKTAALLWDTYVAHTDSLTQELAGHVL